MRRKKTYRCQRKKRKRYRNRLIILFLIGTITYSFISIITSTSKKIKNNIPVSISTYNDEKSNQATDNEFKNLTGSDNTAANPDQNSIMNFTHKDTDIIPGQNITYGGDEFAIPASIVEKMINGSGIDNKKYVFLTFDDGPSYNTGKILDILKEKNAHATFFVLGSKLNNSTEQALVKRCITEGNAIGNHTYSHELNALYPNNIVNINAFMDEFNKTNDMLKSILGNRFETKVLRMPGGYMTRQYYKDPNLDAFDSVLSSKNIVSIDWNALSGDSEGRNYSAAQLLNRAVELSQDKNQIVILMHDNYGKDKTVEMLPQLIDYYKSNGYEFKTIKN